MNQSGRHNKRKNRCSRIVRVRVVSHATLMSGVHRRLMVCGMTEVYNFWVIATEKSEKYEFVSTGVAKRFSEPPKNVCI